MTPDLTPAVEAAAEALDPVWEWDVMDGQPVTIVKSAKDLAKMAVEALGIEQIGWHRADTGVFSAMGGDFDYDYWQPIYRLKALEETK